MNALNFDSPNFPSLCSLSAIISFQTCSNKCILYVLSFHKCIKIKYKTVNMYGVFLWLVQSSSCWNTIHSHRNYMFNCWVFGSANSVTRPDRDNQYNMRIVYKKKKVKTTPFFTIHVPITLQMLPHSPRICYLSFWLSKCHSFNGGLMLVHTVIIKLHSKLLFWIPWLWLN